MIILAEFHEASDVVLKVDFNRAFDKVQRAFRREIVPNDNVIMEQWRMVHKRESGSLHIYEFAIIVNAGISYFTRYATR